MEVERERKRARGRRERLNMRGKDTERDRERERLREKGRDMRRGWIDCFMQTPSNLSFYDENSDISQGRMLPYVQYELYSVGQRKKNIAEIIFFRLL